MQERKWKSKYPKGTSIYYMWCEDLWKKYKQNKIDYILLESDKNKKLFVIKEKNPELQKHNILTQYYYSRISYVVFDLLKDRYDGYIDYKTAYNAYCNLYKE